MIVINMNFDSIWQKLKWIIIILFIIAVIFLYSIVISLYAEIDFQSVFTVLSLIIGGISLISGYQYSKLIKRSNKLNQDTNLTITDLKKIVNDSREIADNSNNTVITMANVDFLRLIGQIEDLRLDLKNSELVKSSTGDLSGKMLFLPKLITKREIYGWKCYTYIREADSILHECDIKIEYVKRFLNIFNLYLEQLRVVRDTLGNDISFSIEEIHHLFMMFKKILGLRELFNKEQLIELDYQKKLERAINHLRYILKEKKDTTIDINYIIELDKKLDSFRKKDKTIRFYDIIKKLSK